MAGQQPAPFDIWQALEQAGATSVQAAGIMGNWIAESRLNPESDVVDSNGYRSYGLAQWNARSYPNAATLVTGDPVADTAAQVRFFFQTVPQSALQGSTPQQVAANVAQNYERCQGCAAGGQSNTTRQANAATVAGWAAASNWPASLGEAADSAALTSAGQAQERSTCLWKLGGENIIGPLNVPSVCVFSKSQGRAIAGAGLLGGGALVAAVGLVLLALGTQLGGSAVQTAAGLIPGVGIAGKAAAAAGGAGASSAAAKEEAAQERHTAAQYRRQRRARENFERDEQRSAGTLADEPAPF